MSLPDLFGDSNSDEENNGKIAVNKKFAVKYQKFKECQELDRLKQKYGKNDDLGEDSSSSGESEDEDAEALTPQIEKDFLDTLSMIKEKDPKIYSKETIFFKSSGSTAGGSSSKKSSKEKHDKHPLLLKDYERQRLLEKEEKAYLSDSDENEQEELLKKQDDLTYVEEQEQLKQSFKHVINSGSDDDTDILHLREKIPNEAVTEKEIHVKNQPKTNSVLKRYWNNDDISSDDKFLRDYILNKKYIVNSVASAASHLPMYNEVVGDSDEAESEAEELNREEEFERKFNFRYEEPDPEFIKRFPRTIGESVRRKDDHRKQQRKLREERKNKEKEKKKEELKRLKNLKRREIMDRIEKLKKITGNDKVGFLEDDMEDDFDVSKYDKLMEDVFDDEYYDTENVDQEKPIFSDSDGGEYGEEIANGDEEYIPHCEDPEFNMDAEYDPKCQFRDGGSKLKKMGKNSKFADAVLRKKPVFDPQEKNFDEYFDEYYKLDFEDIIGDMPIRFKYREVKANDYGLSTEEILKAEDRELNEWCSLRKTTQYLNEDEEKKIQHKYKKKARNKDKKLKVFGSLREEMQGQENSNDPNQINIIKPRNFNKLQKKKAKLHNLNIKSKQIPSRKSMISSQINRKRGSTFSSTNRTRMKNILRHFRGGNNSFVKKVSLERLAAYGLDEHKNKSN